MYLRAITSQSKSIVRQLLHSHKAVVSQLPGFYFIIEYAAYETGSPPLFSLVFIFISRNRLQLSDEISSAKEVIKPEYDAEGQSFVEFTGQRKSSVATVKVVKPGSGRFIIKHVDHSDMEFDITYFYE